MKVRELFEGRIEEVYVTVEYELEYKTPEGDVDYKTLNVSGVVTITPDAYGTGDSPESYEFDVDSVVDAETGDAVSASVIPKAEWEQIEANAYDAANRRR